MRENRTYGSEGGDPGNPDPSLFLLAGNERIQYDDRIVSRGDFHRRVTSRGQQGFSCSQRDVIILDRKRCLSVQHQQNVKRSVSSNGELRSRCVAAHLEKRTIHEQLGSWILVGNHGRDDRIDRATVEVDAGQRLFDV